jgi:cell division protein FtsL
MHNVQRFTQAYAQAPWRKQVQLIGIFLLVLILVALVAGIYLNVTARASTIGRNIQYMQATIDRLELENEDLDTQLAAITSNAQMVKRADELDFQPVSVDEIVYLRVPGYADRKTAVLASPVGPVKINEPTLAPEYTQSLFDWIRVRIFEPAAPLLEVKP